MPAVELAGKWTYRSFHNNPDFVTDTAEHALSLFFAEATFEFAQSKGDTIAGAIDWEGGGLDLKGACLPSSEAAPLTISLVGTGRPGTDTEYWRYDYFAHLAHEWPNGVGQTPALVGSVIRVKPHGGAPAGYVASFIAVKQPQAG